MLPLLRAHPPCGACEPATQGLEQLPHPSAGTRRAPLPLRQARAACGTISGGSGVQARTRAGSYLLALKTGPSTTYHGEVSWGGWLIRSTLPGWSSAAGVPGGGSSRGAFAQDPGRVRRRKGAPLRARGVAARGAPWRSCSRCPASSRGAAGVWRLRAYEPKPDTRPAGKSLGGQLIEEERLQARVACTRGRGDQPRLRRAR